MKKWFFLFFFLLVGTYAIFQSDIGKHWIEKSLVDALKQSGIEIKVEQVAGTLPSQIRLKGVVFPKENIAIEEVSFRPVLWRLLKREVMLKDLHAKGISIHQGPLFDFDGKLAFNKKRIALNGALDSWDIAAKLNHKQKTITFTAIHPHSQVQGLVLLNEKMELISATLRFKNKTALADLIVTKQEMGYLGLGDWSYEQLKGTGELRFQNETLQGSLNAEPQGKMSFNINVLPNFLLVGTAEASLENIQSLNIPDIYGKLQAKANLEVIDGAQALHLDLNILDFYFKTFFAQKASLYSDLKNPFNHPTGLLDVAFEKAKWNDLDLDTASVQVTQGEDNRPFRLFADGKWKHPFEIRMDGVVQNNTTFDIEEFTGTLASHSILLQGPVHLEWPNIPSATFSIDNGTALIDMQKEDDHLAAELLLESVPLDLFSLSPLDVPVSGTLTLRATANQKNNDLQGALIATIREARGTGQFEGTFDQNLLNVKGTFVSQDKPLLDMNFHLPIRLVLDPFDATVLPQKETKGVFDFTGKVEDFLDFLDLGPHRLTGSVHCELQFTNTLYRPFVEGALTFQNGFYENYYTGTELKNITANFSMRENTVYLDALTAQDKEGTGKLLSTGEMKLFAADQYPFALDLEFDRLKFAEIDLVNATAQGKLHIEGNALAALAKGDIHILKCGLTIPDHIPRTLPNLEVTYRNPIHPTPPPQKGYSPYPLLLNVSAFAPETILISGRGLDSKWRGDFHLGGTMTEPTTIGKLELINGEFNFSSRSFKLSDGTLVFSGKEHEMPHIHLTGSMETKGITITAHLQGPLDDPQITLQSSPPLPLGSIMSYLLFGQDVSEIGGFQALQLATSLASLAGAGPDILESTRKSLGIDRLRIITDPDSEGGETISIQVGKYVSEGVLISFTQGTEESSTNISVEVELDNNFVFQIESDQHQEQGRFTLKWSLNY